MRYNELSPEDYTAIFDGKLDHLASKEFPFYPLTAPGMAPAGPNFCNTASNLVVNDPTYIGWMVNWLYHKALYSTVSLRAGLPSGQSFVVETIPGHLWRGEACGPVAPYAEDEDKKPVVMIIGKNPGREEANSKRNMCGPSGDYLRRSLIEAGADEDEIGRWYVTNLVRWAIPEAVNSLPARWIKDCLPLIHQEMRLLCPDYILCLGSEATKTICGRGNTVSNMLGRSIELRIPLHEIGEEEDFHTAKVMSVVHTAAVLRTPELQPQLLSVLRGFVSMVHGKEFSQTHSDVTMETVTTEKRLKEIVDAIKAEPGQKRISVDGEWHGDHAGEPESYLRSIQFSPDGRRAYVVSLTGEGGSPRFTPSIASAISHLNRLLCDDDDPVLIIGHFFSADMPWLAQNGLDLVSSYCVPDTPAECYGGNYIGGFDTALAAHAHNETDLLKLEIQASRYCGAPRWDIELQSWVDEYCSSNGIKSSDLGGYGMIPDEILIPYSAYDVIYTWRLHKVYSEKNGLLERDKYGNNCWAPFISTMRAFPAIVEINTQGILTDRDRIDALTDLFIAARNKWLQSLRDSISWPDFNPRSSQQCVEMLFGEEFSTRRNKRTGARISVRPKGARSLYLTPVKTTGKPRPWSRVVDEGKVDQNNPSTDKETCGVLGMHNAIALSLRDVRMLDQVLTGVFRLPEVEDGKLVQDEYGNRVYKGGIASYVCHDGRVRTTIIPTAETGRGKSARPNCQNLANRREGDYSRLLGGTYTHKIRSFFVASPGCVLLEADYTGAELLVMAVMSRDKTMIDHCLRANFPDGHPDQYNIHANIAVRAFRLDCEPTKTALKAAGHGGTYVSAKGVIFGTGYGMGAEACARQAQEEGVLMTTEEAQTVIDTIFTEYPGILQLQKELKERVLTPGWIKTYFGRYRRFIPSDNQQVLGELERQALNFPMQSTVADAINKALYYLYHHPRKAALGYKIILQIHDAVLLEVPAAAVDEVYNKILPECMVDNVVFRACDASGTQYADGKDYRFGIERDIGLRWGEKITVEQCKQLNLSPEFAN